MAWSFNASSPAGSPVGLYPANSGMTALASAGNAMTSMIGLITTRQLSGSPVGGDWSFNRTIGSPLREVLWNWRVAAKSQSDMNALEAIFDAYLLDGGLYTLTNGTRSSDYAKLVKAVPRSRHITTTSGRVLRDYDITFHVLRPQAGEDKL